ncbi:MAG: hypothetical protein H7246_22315 [Phycisphaerae bacterium]|nr:hypothetical protein [Saprospiraceae bacterium]
MKNFFELFGFLSTACISAALIFIFIGKKDDLKGESKGGFLTEMGADAEVANAPRSISDRPMRSNSVAGSKRDKAARPSEANTSASSDERLQSLYDDNEFVAATAKQWKGLVRDAADEYNVKPQVLLAHVLVQSYLGDYSRNQLYNDAARHAGERLKPTAAAIKGYRYGWSMQKLINEHDLQRYFPEERSTVAAAVGTSTSRKVVEKNSTSKGVAKYSAPVAKNNPVEEGFKNMVAKEYGFGSWAGLQKLADPDTKSEAARRVKSLMMASRVR